MTNFNFLSKFNNWLGELSSRMSLVGVSCGVSGVRVAREAIEAHRRVSGGQSRSKCATQVRKANIELLKAEWLKCAAAIILVLTIGVGNVWGEIADGTYVLCTSTSDLEAGAHYIIASGTSGSVYCISNVANENNRKTVSASVSSSKIIVASNSSIMTLTLGGSSDAWTFHTDNYAGTAGYLASAASGDKNYCRVISTSTTGTISFSNSQAVITLNPHTSRTILRYNSTASCFACYSSGQAAVYLYKKQSCTSISPTLSYSTDSIGIGGTATVASLNKDGSTGSVTYSISPASGVATINASTGELTGTGTGNVTVTATIAAAGGKCEGTATATIKVRRGITYYVGATSYTVGGIDGNTLVSTLPASPSSCDDTNYPYFYGWKNGSISGISSSAPTILSSELVSSSTAANTYYAVFTNVANLTFGFESGEDETGWTNVITGMSNLGSYVDAHGGSRAASVSGSTTTIIQTANKIIPSAFSAWITKESGNTDTPSEWKLQKSTDGSSWTDVASWSATSPARGTWNKITLSAAQIASITVESYIRIILYTTISAYRDMDDVSISYGTGDPEYITTCCTKLGQINGSFNWT